MVEQRPLLGSAAFNRTCVPATHFSSMIQVLQHFWRMPKGKIKEACEQAEDDDLPMEKHRGESTLK